jgi:hypothetical protein
LGQEKLDFTNIINTKSLLMFVGYCTAAVVLVTIFFTLRHNKNTKLPEGFYDVEGIPTSLDTSTLNEVQKLEISKAVRYRNWYKKILQILLI